MSPPTSDKYAFLKMQAPPSYVAGLGRGASGFTTRSDIGPAREGPSLESVNASRQARGESALEDSTVDQDSQDQFQDPDSETNLFSSAPYDREDEEADKIYESVDQQLEKRGQSRRLMRERLEQERLERDRPKIQTQFADLKRSLGEVSDQEWESLPEVGNIAGRGHKKIRKEGNLRTYAIPDSVLLSQRDQVGIETSLDSRQMNGDITPAGDQSSTTGVMTNFVEIGAARDKVLGLKLDQVKDSVSGSTTIDPKGYLTQMNSIVYKTEAEIGDIKRARALLDSLIKSNKTHPPGWIAAARVEVAAGKQVTARRIMAQACVECPKSQDVWLESANLNTPENAKVILANAVTHLPHSVNIWLKAVNLEHEIQSKKRVMRKALEYVPTSVKLWKEAVNLEENPQDARILLQRAVEVVPFSDELWLTLARLETPEKAKQVLNKARQTIPTSHQIWIAACRLEEQEGKDLDRISSLMIKGVQALKKNGAELPREQWIKEAEKCESQKSVITCQAIVRATIDLDIEEEDRRDIWLEDSQSSLVNGFVETSRAILSFALNVYPNRSEIWRRAADLEKSHGTSASLLKILERAVNCCPHSEILWLMAAKEAWQTNNDVDGARKILGDAFEANPESEQVWLAAVKLESENGQIEAAKQLMKRARDVAGTERIWMKNAVFERQHGSIEEALNLTQQALAKFPASEKLHMIKGQILEFKNDINGAREAYSTGTKRCPRSITLWILSSRLEERVGLTIKARAIMERARHHNPKNDRLWSESCSIEERATGHLTGNNSSTSTSIGTQAKNMISRALQDCPTSGLLHAQSIWYEPRPQRKRKGVDALKSSNNHPEVIVTVGRLLWQERKLDKVRNWFEKAIIGDSDNGDYFGIYYKFLKMHGSQEERDMLVEKCKSLEPHHGPIWQSVVKGDYFLNKINKDKNDDDDDDDVQNKPVDKNCEVGGDSFGKRRIEDILEIVAEKLQV
ncbi:PRP1 splicing factor, N-terminal-domain-containing protein [Phakopsora pachyrhizi]|uniref:PRP1 splicing factor, N-terminal-domain-containing protein n=1 Tax=Phakopsora pachyrhizi TaxID=170000 RepID=A0AAV0BP11_PHAPC|nr:PRP1 splicing factor, N-terminal-domain-containing protein [Phakopsora pachyrhizi]CAH7689019.1 PRP1 splicing factor, N-terminal-domain-containing protein [Phakopsora pachyrhizi]